ncbi:MAG TPA: DmsC/YnfH family molybdoenzyme membrane anchor subunit, partial [Cellulomonas sp.]
MNTHELPMIIFTVLAQMSVGAFVVLGVVQVVASRRFGKESVDKVTDPALYAIGPALVLGLVASMFHMNDVFHTLNVVRHIGSSWLSREIVFG